MGYSFMTIEKIKNIRQMNAKYKHNYREMEVINADSSKKELNDEMVSLDGKTYKEAFEERTKKLGYGKDKKIRKNAVYGFEIVTTFSREDAKDIDIEKWKENNVKWLRETFNADPEKNGDNVLSVMFHADEPGNVHCHAFVIPIDDKGNLNARYYVQSRQKMIALQDSYGKLMKEEHNLERGLHGSKARHQDIKRYYTSLNMALDKELPNVKEGETVEEYRNRANELYKDSSLKNMGLEKKIERLEIEKSTLAKTVAGAAKKEVYDKYFDEIERLRELESEYGNIKEIKNKCENYDNLIQGIANEEENEDIILLVNALIENGKKIKEKEKQKKIEEIL